jgi:S1-C subfamily serine protease/Flp pilus assembly protein TadD
MLDEIRFRRLVGFRGWGKLCRSYEDNISQIVMGLPPDKQAIEALFQAIWFGSYHCLVNANRQFEFDKGAWKVNFLSVHCEFFGFFMHYASRCFYANHGETIGERWRDEISPYYIQSFLDLQIDSLQASCPKDLPQPDRDDLRSCVLHGVNEAFSAYCRSVGLFPGAGQEWTTGDSLFARLAQRLGAMSNPNQGAVVAKSAVRIFAAMGFQVRVPAVAARLASPDPIVLSAARADEARVNDAIRQAMVVRGSRGKTGTAPNAENAARRWPWKRIASWSANWHTLIILWLIFGTFRILNYAVPLFGTEAKGKSVSFVAAWVTPLFIEIVFLVFYWRIFRLLGQQIDAAGRLLQILQKVLVATDLFLIFVCGPRNTALDSASAASRLLVAVILLLLATPLTNPRFRDFSALLRNLSEYGVPEAFILRRGWFQRWPKPAIDLALPYVIRPDEPKILMSRTKLLRAIAGFWQIPHLKVILPENIEFPLASTATPPQRELTPDAGQSQAANLAEAPARPVETEVPAPDSASVSEPQPADRQQDDRPTLAFIVWSLVLILGTAVSIAVILSLTNYGSRQPAAAVANVSRPTDVVGTPTPTPPAVTTTPKPAGQDDEASLPPDQLFRAASLSVFVVDVADDKQNWAVLGSGFLISGDGLLVTNFHVIRNGSCAKIETASGQKFAVTGVVAADPNSDLAILQTDAKGQPFLNLGADTLPAIGTHVYAIGNPEGLVNSLSDGLISGVRTDESIPMLQTTAAISHGSSGGPLLTADAKVVGVTSEMFVGAENLNFAVPVSNIRRLIANRGTVQPFAVAAQASSEKIDQQTLDNVSNAIDQDKYDSAQKMLASLQHRQDQNGQYWYLSAKFQYFHAEDYAAAASAYQRAIDLGCKDPTDAYDGLGYSLLNAKQYDQSIDAFRQCVRLDPNTADAWEGAALAFCDMGKCQQALGIIDKAIHLRSDDAVWYSIRGYCYLKLKQYADARVAYGQYEQIQPDNADGWDGLGDAAYGEKDYTSAELYYKTALAKKPDDAYAWDSLGYVLSSENETGAAAAAYRNAIRLDPNGLNGSNATAGLRELEN